MDSEQSDHDLLIEIKQDVCWLKKVVGNHLKHHWMLEIGLLVVLAGAIAAKIWG